MPLDPTELRAVAERYFSRLDYLFQPDWLPPMAPEEEGFWDYGPKMKVNFLRWCAEAMFFQEEDYVETRYRCAMRVAKRRGTWLVLGLREYREANGQWPDSLDQISGFVPPEVFRDPTNGDPFVYVHNDDYFKLYSKGANGIDEDGRDSYWTVTTTKDDDIPIWPPPVRQPPSKETREALEKQLKEIYGDRFRMGKPEDANGV